VSDTVYKRIVVKLGTSVITAEKEELSKSRLLSIVQQVSSLADTGCEVVVVSSGAVAAGRVALGNPELSKMIPSRQMLSAIGQPRLMHLYADLFEIFGYQVAQVLLTNSDLRNRTSYLNARDTLHSLIDQGVIPIVNENDTVATQEIRLGDNDNLSGLVANLIDADLLAILTDQPGLFTTDPRSDANAKLISSVERIDDAVFSSAGGAGSMLGTGGMHTKLQAAQLATRSGTNVVIAQGSRPNVLLELIQPDGEKIGTWFPSTVTHIESRKRWLLSERIQGSVLVDKGAARILRTGEASLLPVGVTDVEGEFERGVAVRVVDPKQVEVARGLVKYNSKDLRRLCGVQSNQIIEKLGYTYGDEVIHRDHLVILD